MRKQTKVVAVASAATLLAIGASMTSFAATGWVEEDGIWYFYDNDGNRVEDEWKKSGDNWYWLDAEEGGAMAVDKLVEDDDDTYYVDSNGVMVKNTWVKVVNEDQDEDEDPAEYNYYYMQSNGKAYKAPESENVRFRTIDGKKYAFDDDGKMLYGWVSLDGERQTDEDGWAEDGLYYLGSWEDGAMKTGWQKITVHDDEEDDDMDYWFNFKSNGKKRKADKGVALKEEKINGKKFGFDDRGVMTYEWTITSTSVASGASSANWRYFSNPEDGARVTKGWFRVVAPHEDNDNVFKSDYKGNTFAEKDADEENERWYYADSSGVLYTGKIEKIKGKYYGFRPEGDAGDNKGSAMLSGLVLMTVNKTTGEIEWVYDDAVDSDELDDLLDWDPNSEIVKKLNGETVGSTKHPGVDFDDPSENWPSLYYFGDDEVGDGAMRTGSTTINLDGKTYNFLFSKTGGAENRGRGLTGVDDDKYIYSFGCRIKADSDDKYQVVQVKGVGKSLTAVDVNAEGVNVTKIKSSELRNQATKTAINDDGSFRYNDVSDEGYWLVNTSGSVQNNKGAAKDGDEWYFWVDDREVKLYSSDKDLKEVSPGTKNKWEDYTNKDDAKRK